MQFGLYTAPNTVARRRRVRPADHATNGQPVRQNPYLCSTMNNILPHVYKTVIPSSQKVHRVQLSLGSSTHPEPVLPNLLLRTGFPMPLLQICLASSLRSGNTRQFTPQASFRGLSSTAISSPLVIAVGSARLGPRLTVKWLRHQVEYLDRSSNCSQR